MARISVSRASSSARRYGPRRGRSGCQRLDQAGPGDADGVGHSLRREPAGGGDGKRKAVFWARGLQGLAQDLGLHGFAAEKAFEFADAVLELPEAAEGDDFLV